MTKSEAIAKIERQIAAIDDLKRLPSGSPQFKKWHRDTQVAIRRIFGDGGRQLEDFDSIHFSLTVFSNFTPDSAFEEAYREGLETARSVLSSMVDEVREYWEEADSASRAVRASDPVSMIERICTRFPLIVRKLRDRRDDRPTLEVEDEYDVQDLLHALLALYFDDIRREEWTPTYAGGASRMDFLLKEEQIVVEVKKTRKGLDAKRVGEELLVDIQRYRAHPDCRLLFCFVYDPEARIANPRGVERDLTGPKDALEVRTLIIPKGT